MHIVRTRIYIDGYNFYYGCLKNTAYKWLDLVSLFEDHLIPRSAISSSTLHPEAGIKFYTAEISSKAAEDPSSVNDQRSYHAALTSHSQGAVKIVKGSYAIDKVDSRKVEYTETQEEKEPKDCSKVKVWKLEEKQSDVNIALDAIFDAFCDHSLEHIVFVTNDTDIAPALVKIRELNTLAIRPQIKIGLVIPSKERYGPRRANKSLSQLADWTIQFISDDELKSAQMPCRVTGGKKSAFRPISWFQHHQEVAEIMEILCAKEACGSLPKAWRWLSEEKPIVDGLPELESDPSTMLHSIEGLQAVRVHAEAYARYMKEKHG